MKLFVAYSKAPEQPQSSARPMCHSHTMTNTGREPATIRIAAYRSSPRYALRHRRRRFWRARNILLWNRYANKWRKTKFCILCVRFVTSTIKWYFQFKYNSMHPEFTSTAVRTHDLQIMAVYFMSLRCLTNHSAISDFSCLWCVHFIAISINCHILCYC